MESDVEVAIRAAVAGASEVRSRFGGELERFAESGVDFATSADLAAERAITAVLADARPADAFVGEETGGTVPGSGRVWLVDPLCGTVNYAARTPLAAVNVALRVGPGVVAAAVADPFSGEVFWTDGEVARVRVAGDEPLRPDPSSRLVDVNLDVPDQAVLGMLADNAFTTAFQPRVFSTTLALAWVASGRRAAYVTAGDLRDSVHFTSAIALCEAAGCVVTGIAGGPLHTGPHGLVAAADPDTHTALVQTLTRL
ncbi:inositol monophosphatase family protein [Actinosynnema sp. NPDC047251]|uniref:Inositol-phosphate phosphatase n=1 Tax=Saccharothrix espanaensis (strain ATCC 51144 / DSM 44229 / JCM 9112 / NBRC 15066 / NRRL 15764) TaxID=1179773 RepID=K0K332_SACES|nr:inositol monophosphatase family protein [Saccharothrix espanaensis]CCH30973.1 Inositol-phosphate phosphatase [Saccharothrix espanaensis DSM 44229]